MNLRERLSRSPFIQSLSYGSVPWVFLFALAAFQFSLFSIPSEGWPKILIPGFMVASVGLAFACYTRKTCHVVWGGTMLVLCSITRGVALWGVGQGGAGSNHIASFVWFWIALLTALFTLAVWHRGIEPPLKDDEIREYLHR
jgi:hypothetical protein